MMRTSTTSSTVYKYSKYPVVKMRVATETSRNNVKNSAILGFKSGPVEGAESSVDLKILLVDRG